MKRKTKKITLVSLLCAFTMSIGCFFAQTYHFIAKATDGQVQAQSENKKLTDIWEAYKFTTISMGEVPSNFIPGMKGRKGLKVVSKGSGATVNFKNAINISELTDEELLLRIAILPTARGNHDFGKLTVRLTDTEDSTNYVDLVATIGGTKMNNSTYYYAGTSDLVPAGNRSGYYREPTQSDIDRGITSWVSTAQGTEIDSCPFSGIPTAGSLLPLTIKYDTETQTAYTEKYKADGSAGSQLLIRNFTDTRQTAPDYKWKGFTSNRVYVSIIADHFAASSATYIITDFMGVEMSSEVIEDVDSPTMWTEADSREEILRGVVGVEYPLFDARTDDFVDGEITNITKTLTYPDGRVEELTADSFVPNRAGIYQLKYSAQDNSENRVEKTYAINCSMTAEPIIITPESEIPFTMYVGQEFSLPTATVTGGIGLTDYKVSVVRVLDGVEVTDVDNKYVFPLEGEYEITYSAKDYLGTEGFYRKTITAEASLSPLCKFPYVTDRMIAGKTVKLPTMVAYDYASNPAHGKNAIVEIYESDEQNNPKTKISNLYTPTLGEGESSKVVYITYSAYCEGYESYALSKEHPVEIVKFEQLNDNFKTKDVTTNITKEHIEFNTTTEGASAKYMTPLSLNNLDIELIIPKDKANFNSLVFTFADSEDISKNIQMEIIRRTGTKQADVLVNGKAYSMFFEENADGNFKFVFTFAANGMSVNDNLSELICALNTYSDGTDYTGFESGKMYFTFAFKGVNGDSSIYLNKLARQKMAARYDSNGNVTEFKDVINPAIVFSGEVPNKAEKNSLVTIPSAIALDSIDPYTDCFVTVTVNGNVVVAKTSADKPISFIAKEYGNYIITYSATDSNKIATSIPRTLNVEDSIAPSIVIDGAVPTTISIGSNFIVPEAVALDTVSEATLNVFLIDPYGEMVFIEDNNYKLTIYGEYTLRYCAYDYNYNYAIIDITFTVK